MVKIRDQLVATSVARTRISPGTNPRRYITVHETANRSRGAGAAAHANLQSRGNARAASWHYQVDDREIVRSYRDTVRCWHAGDGGGHGNMSSIAIEICVNVDGDYERALANAADLVRYLRAKHGIPRERVVQHNHWSGKNCPTILRSRGAAAWRSFVASTDPMGVKPTTPTSNPVPVSSEEFDMSQEQYDTIKSDLNKIKTALEETQLNSRHLPPIRDRVTKTNHAAGRSEIVLAQIARQVGSPVDTAALAAALAEHLDIETAVAEALSELPDRDTGEIAAAVVSKIANRLQED